ncbi:MAG: methionine--tRNA ligase [Myxococcales bacterium]|nr:methionine--tRNA ligase [Myxococcales bacterium]
MTTRTLVTCALPYANGPVHLGHMVEHVQTDLYVRYLRSRGDDVVFLCADDTHGAPIELNALKQGVSPEEFVARWAGEHQKDFADFQISFDHYGSTNSPENRHYAELIYGRAKAAGSIVRKDVEQPYDEKSKRWLSDRFIRGTCPNCGAPDQYGDACEKCNATYTPRELKDARSAISGEPLTWKKSSHLFFALSKHEAFLRAQLAKPGFTHPGPAAQLGQFFDKGLADWDITRDGPYFGFQIPGEDNKYFYVWLDAPIGYIASCEQWAKKTGKAKDALEYWDESSNARIVHVIGKDIVYFHCLFWPAVLHVARLKLPEYVHIHGHLTVNGEKMSKSRGTFINARPYLDLLDPNYLRFYYASLLGPGPEDLDFNLTEFRQRVNAELVNNLGNLANRTLSLLARPELGKKLAPPKPELGKGLVEKALARVPEIAQAFGSFDHRTAVKAILEVGYAANQFLTQHEPWKTIKHDVEGARAVLSEAAEVVYLLTALLDPIVPQLAGKLTAQLGRAGLTFKALDGAKYPLLDRAVAIGEPSPLISRLEEAQVARLIAAPPEAAKPAPAPQAKKEQKDAKGPAAPPAEIEYDDFAKVQLKAGKVLAAEKVEKADKLLKLTIDLGEGAPRTIVSGIAEAYAPEAVTGKRVVVVANLKPRPLRGIESRGMILTAGPGGKDLVLLDPGDVPPGSDVK